MFIRLWENLMDTPLPIEPRLGNLSANRRKNSIRTFNKIINRIEAMTSEVCYPASIINPIHIV